MQDNQPVDSKEGKAHPTEVSFIDTLIENRQLKADLTTARQEISDAGIKIAQLETALKEALALDKHITDVVPPIDPTSRTSIEWQEGYRAGFRNGSIDFYYSQKNHSNDEIALLKQSYDTMKAEVEQLRKKANEGRDKKEFGEEDTKELHKTVCELIERYLHLGKRRDPYTEEDYSVIEGRIGLAEIITHTWAGMLSAVYEGAEAWENDFKDMKAEADRWRGKCEEAEKEAQAFVEWTETNHIIGQEVVKGKWMWEISLPSTPGILDQFPLVKHFTTQELFQYFKDQTPQQ